MQQTPGFISSLVIKVAIDKISLLFKHDSSGQLPPLLWTSCRSKMTHTSNFWLSLFRSWFKWDCGISTGDGRFPQSQNISI